MNDLIIIPLDYGLHAFIDAADADIVLPYEWRALAPQVNKDGSCHYQVSAAIPGIGAVSLHRYLMGACEGQLVDHRNRNSLDFRRSNLRFATQSQSSCNRSKFFKRGNVSRYKGAYPRGRGRWYAAVTANYETHRAGPFASEEEAARAYDDLAREWHGEFACLNFPDGDAA